MAFLCLSNFFIGPKTIFDERKKYSKDYAEKIVLRNF